MAYTTKLFQVQILGVVPGVPKNSDVSPKVSRGNGGCGNGEDVRGTSRWSEPAPSSGEAGGSTPRPVGPQQQQQHGGHERGAVLMYTRGIVY